VYVVEVFSILAHISLEVIYAYHVRVRGVCRAVDAHIILVYAHTCIRGQRDKGAARDELVDDLFFEPVCSVLLVCYLVDIAVAEELAVYAHVFLERNRIAPGLVIRHAERHEPHGRHRKARDLIYLAGEIDLLVCARYAMPEARRDGRPDLLVLFLAVLPIRRAAVGAAPSLVPVRLFLRLFLALGPELAVYPAHSSAPALVVRREPRAARNPLGLFLVRLFLLF